MHAHLARFANSLLLACLLASAGCTSIPQQKFAAYQEAFQTARTQSENVIADYAAARTERNQIPRPGVTATKPADTSLSAILNFAPYSAQPPKPGADAVQTRLAAWNVLAKYNEALAAIAAGVKTSEVESSVNGFVNALKEFPVEEVASIGAEIAPYGKAIEAVISIVEKEVQARRFKNAVLEAALPLEKFNRALQRDAELFYGVRMTLYDRKHGRLINGIRGRVDQFTTVVQAHQWTLAPDVNAAITDFNGLANVTPTFRLFDDIAAISAGGAVPVDQQAAEIRDLQAIQAGAAEMVKDLRENLRQAEAYRAMMDQYAALLRTFESTQKGLIAAVEKNSNQLPSTAQLHEVISTVRLAHQIYTSSK